jgi:D-psicose/D-tagatose/L-ribulose 3-epimerase
MRIEFFVNTWIFGDAELKEIAERVSALGYDGIELVGEPKAYPAKETSDLIKSSGLKVCSICGMFPGPDKNDLRALCHPDAKERQSGVDYIKSCVDLASGVGAGSVLIVPGLVGQPGYFKSKEEDRKRAVESIAKAGEYAKNNRMPLTIEPINRYEVGLVNSIDDALKMAKEIGNPFVRIMGDTFHMQIEEGDGIPNAIRRAGGDWLKHMHAADNTREAPGMGTMNWREILRALHDIGYQGGVSLEPLPKGASPYDARNGKIPKKQLDDGLKYGLEHLRREQEIVLKI